MMSLLSVTVKKARYVGAQASQFNTYVTLKLQNVKSTTVTVKGATPCWEQDFLFETNNLNTGLLIEVWSKGMIWDRAMGYHWIPLQSVQYANEEGSGHWLSLEAELVMRDGEVVGTKNPTGHSLLVDCRFELPFDPENIEASDLQRKLEMLNNIMDQEARAEQARRQMQYFGHSNYNQFDNEISAGYSEDSDYTSDLNYPVGQHANSSASQFRSAAHQIHTPQRSLETSRENSYEKDDGVGHHLPTPVMHQHHLSPGSHRQKHHLQQRYSPNAADYGYGSPNVGQNSRQYHDNNIDAEPLSYNSRPKNKADYPSQDIWDNYKQNYNYNQNNLDSIDVGYSIESEYYDAESSRKPKEIRRPSLERQTTLYDDSNYYLETTYYPTKETMQIAFVDTSGQAYNQNQSCDEYFDASSYLFQEERYGQDEEDRQWDSGGYFNNKTNGKKLPAIPVVQKRRSSFVAYEDGYSCAPTPTHRRLMPTIPTKRCSSRQSSLNDEYYDGYRTPENTSHRGASLPPTPTKMTKIMTRLGNTKPFNSLPPTPGRQLPKPNLSRSAKVKRNNLMKRTSSADYSDNLDNFDNYVRAGAVSAREIYNEDYNYAYQSIDNLPGQVTLNDRTSVNVNEIVKPYHQQYSDEYYYSAQEERGYILEGNHYENDRTSRRKKLLGRRENSPLLQQNTDSLESRDDELKDSFETAISSISSSLHQKRLCSEAEEVITSSTGVVQAIDTIPKTVVTAVQYHRDQIESPKAIVSTPPARTNENLTNRNVNNRAYLKTQSSIESYYQNDEINGGYLSGSNEIEYQEKEDEEEDYLDQQESIESYTEEGTITNGGSVDYNKAINRGESPASVIHVENYEEEPALRRGSSQITVVDPYHPSLQRPVDAYIPPASRRASLDPYRSTSPRRMSTDVYQPNNEDYITSPPRKPSVDVYQPPSRKASVRHSPPPVVQPQQNQEVIVEKSSPAESGSPEKKSVSFEEEEEEPSKTIRPQVTAQQRWLWAYNKIVMQLNVA